MAWDFRKGYRRQWRFLLSSKYHPSRCDREWTEYEALNDILDQTAGVDRQVSMSGITGILPRSHVYLSLRALQKRWRWASVGRVSRFVSQGSKSLVAQHILVPAPHLNPPGNRAGSVYFVSIYDRPPRAEDDAVVNDSQLSLFGASTGNRVTGDQDTDSDAQTNEKRVTKRNTKRVTETTDTQGLDPPDGTQNGTQNGTHLKELLKSLERGEEGEAPPTPDFESQFERVAACWQETTGQEVKSTRAKRRQLAARLLTFTEDELCRAIRGMKRDPWHNGSKDGKKRMIWGLIFRSDESVEELHDLAPNPQPAVQTWLEEPETDNIPDEYRIEYHELARQLTALTSQHLNSKLSTTHYEEQSSAIKRRLDEICQPTTR